MSLTAVWFGSGDFHAAFLEDSNPGRRGRLGLEAMALSVNASDCVVLCRLYGGFYQDRKGWIGWSLLQRRGRMVTLHNLLEHLAANTWVILKIAIISFFIVNCWPYAVESALLNFAKNAFIILPYTHDIHVLAVHVEMSLLMMLNQIGFLRSRRASPLRPTLRSRTPRAEPPPSARLSSLAGALPPRRRLGL